MEKIINYFNSYPKFTLVLILTFVVSFIIIALIGIFYKKTKSIKPNDLQKNQENEQNSLNLASFENKNQPEPTNFLQNNEVIEEQANLKDTIQTPKQERDTTQPQTGLEQENEEIKEDTTNSRYNGKWIIYQAEERYFADLKASNGELMLRTETYSSLSGIKSGIETLKKNIEAENFAINLDKNGNFVFKIFSTSKRLLCVGEGYSTREQCEKAFVSVKRFSKTAK